MDGGCRLLWKAAACLVHKRVGGMSSLEKGYLAILCLTSQNKALGSRLLLQKGFVRCSIFFCQVHTKD